MPAISPRLSLESTFFQSTNLGSPLPPRQDPALPVPELSHPAFHAIVQFCNHFIIPVIIITGIVGNVLTFLVFVFSSLKRLSTSVYLAALALVDCGFLCSLGAGWLDNFTFFQQQVVCTCMVYATYICSFMSVWLVVCFMTEMYLTLFHEDLAARASQPYRARVVVCALTLLCGVFYLYTFWTTKQVTTPDGWSTCEFVATKDVRMALLLADTFLTLLLPFSLLIFMNIRIVIVIVGFSRRRGLGEGEEGREGEEAVTMTATDRSEARRPESGLDTMLENGKGHALARPGSLRRNSSTQRTEVNGGHVTNRDHDGLNGVRATGRETAPLPTADKSVSVEVVNSYLGDTCELDFPISNPEPAHSRTSKMQSKSFKMLLTVAFVFLILNLPSHAIRLQGLLRSFITPSYVTSEMEHLCQQLFQILYYFNFMSNFLIYSACAKSFRTAFTSLPSIFSKACRCRKNHKEEQHALPSSRRVGENLRRIREEQNSRLVELNLADLQISKMESFSSNFKYHSPPCLLRISDAVVDSHGKDDGEEDEDEV